MRTSLPRLHPSKAQRAWLWRLSVCHLVASMELPVFTYPFRVGRSSSLSIFHGFKNGGNFSAVVNDNLRFRASWSGEIGVRVGGNWNGASEIERVGIVRVGIVRAIKSRGNAQSGEEEDEEEQLKLCVRCGMTYRDEDNSPIACKYHGHMTGDQGLYALAPPHQGIDGEWTDASGVIVYKWNNENERPSTGSENWKRRWTCCGVYAEDAAPCQSGRHVSYDDGATRY